MKRIDVAVRFAVASMLVAACGSDIESRVEETESAPPSVEQPDDPAVTVDVATTTDPDGTWLPDPNGGADGPVAYQDGGPNGEEAEVGGVLTLDDGCLYLDGGRARRPAVLWPNGTRWDAATQSVVMVDAVTAPLGARLIGNGGYSEFPQPDAVAVDGGVEALVANCSPAGGFATVGFMEVVETPEVNDSPDTAHTPMPIPTSSFDLGLPVARPVSAADVSFGCLGDVTYTEPPADLSDLESAPDEVVEAIDRIDGWGSLFISSVDEWAVIDRGGAGEEVTAFGIVDADDPTARTRYAFVTLEPAQAGGYRYTQWGECFMQARVGGYAPIQVSEVRLDAETGALVVTGMEGGCPRDEDDPVDVISIVQNTDAGPTLALFSAADRETGLYSSCQAAPVQDFVVAIAPDVDVATLLDGQISPPHAIGERPEPATGGMTTVIPNMDPAVNRLLRSLSQNSPVGGVISHGELLIDAAPGRAGVLVLHTPGNRAAASVAVDELLATADVPIVYEEQTWTLDQARRLSNELSFALDTDTSAVLGGVDGVRVDPVRGRYTQEELERVIEEIDRIIESMPELAEVPVTVSQ